MYACCKALYNRLSDWVNVQAGVCWGFKRVITWHLVALLINANVSAGCVTSSPPVFMRKCQMRVFSCSQKANLNLWTLKINTSTLISIIHGYSFECLISRDIYQPQTLSGVVLPHTLGVCLRLTHSHLLEILSLVLLREDASRACRKKTTYLL